MKELTNRLIKDLKILDDTLYSCRITVRMGAKPTITIKLEDILDQKSIKLWNQKFPKRKSPEVEVFGDLRISYNKVVHQKEKLYDKYAINFGIYTNVIPGSNLEIFLTEYQEKVVGTAKRELTRIKGVYKKRLGEYLEDVRTILDQVSVVSDQKLLQYEKQFPSIQNIEKFFGPVMEGPYQMPSIHDAAQLDLRLKSVIRQTQLEKTKIAQLNARQQQYWGMAGQVQQVRDGILEKIFETKINILKNLKYHLETIQRKDSFHSSSGEPLKDIAELDRTFSASELIQGIMGDGYSDIVSKTREMVKKNKPSMSSEIILMIESELYISENLDLHHHAA